MARKFRITGAQKFTDTGRIGVWMFILSPAAAGLFYFWWLYEIAKPYDKIPGVAASLCFIASVAFFISIPLIVVGRTETFNIEVDE